MFTCAQCDCSVAESMSEYSEIHFKSSNYTNRCAKLVNVSQTLFELWPKAEKCMPRSGVSVIGQTVRRVKDSFLDAVLLLQQGLNFWCTALCWHSVEGATRIVMLLRRTVYSVVEKVRTVHIFAFIFKTSLSNLIIFGIHKQQFTANTLQQTLYNQRCFTMGCQCAT